MPIQSRPLLWALGISLCLGSFATASAAAPAPSPSAAPAIFVPRGTIVPVVVTKEIRVGGFGHSQEEHKVKFAVSQDVVVNGYVIAKQGDLAEGTYVTQTNETKRVFSTNVSQELEVDMDDVVNFCGDTIHLEFSRTFVGGGRAGAFSFGPHAHDAVFSKGSVLKASTDRIEKSICAEKTTELPVAMPSDIVVPDDEASPAP
jgi:hypothetical protein